jgi:hypothetical protein
LIQKKAKLKKLIITMIGLLEKPMLWRPIFAKTSRTLSYKRKSNLIGDRSEAWPPRQPVWPDVFAKKSPKMASY